jgi:hypothetical protein
LLLTQFQLLWLAAFHWQEDPFPAVNCALAVRSADDLGSPSSYGKTPCVVCQIVRQNAIRPAVIAPTPRPLSAFSFLPLASSQGFHFYRSHVANDRAPPLV